MRRGSGDADSRHRVQRSGALICHAFNVHVFSCRLIRERFARDRRPWNRIVRRSTRIHSPLSIQAYIRKSGFPEIPMTGRTTLHRINQLTFFDYLLSPCMSNSQQPRNPSFRLYIDSFEGRRSSHCPRAGTRRRPGSRIPGLSVRNVTLNICAFRPGSAANEFRGEPGLSEKPIPAVSGLVCRDSSDQIFSRADKMFSRADDIYIHTRRRGARLEYESIFKLE